MNLEKHVYDEVPSQRMNQANFHESCIICSLLWLSKLFPNVICPLHLLMNMMGMVMVEELESTVHMLL